MLLMLVCVCLLPLGVSAIDRYADCRLFPRGIPVPADTVLPCLAPRFLSVFKTAEENFAAIEPEKAKFSSLWMLGTQGLSVSSSQICVVKRRLLTSGGFDLWGLAGFKR